MACIISIIIAAAGAGAVATLLLMRGAVHFCNDCRKLRRPVCYCEYCGARIQ